MKLSLRSKLFAAILTANLLLAFILVSAANYAFEQRFQRYAANNEVKRLEPIMDLLALEYREHGWQRMETFRQRLPMRRHFALRDVDEQILISPPSGMMATHWQPLVVDGQTVASIGIPKRGPQLAELDRQFLLDIQSQWLRIVLVAVLISAAVAMVLAAQLSKPVRQISQALHHLAKGNYRQRLNLSRRDELGQLAADVDWLAQALSDHQQARERWVADIAHELRTPLAILQADIEAIEDGIRPLDNAAIERLKHEQIRLSALVNDLAELARSDAGGLSYQWQSIDLYEHLGQFLALHCPTAKLSGERCQITADPERLNQLWHNLLSNSLHYSDSPMALAVTLSEHHEQVQICWSDSAPGVAPEHHAKLFDRLYRVEQSRSRHQGGSGLGLAIAAQIVKAHQGSISARPSPLGGLTIKIELANQ